MILMEVGGMKQDNHILFIIQIRIILLNFSIVKIKFGVNDGLGVILFYSESFNDMPDSDLMDGGKQRIRYHNLLEFFFVIIYHK
jgi:hypothetical protein